MPAPTRITNAAYLYFTGSFDSASGISTLFISGTGNNSSGSMPLFLRAKESKNEALSLYLLSVAKTSSWESLGNSWSSYNISCSVGAPTFCQDWEYIPYYSAGASGIKASFTIFEKGAYRGSVSGSMPLFIQNSGAGLIDSRFNLFLHAKNDDALSTGVLNLVSFGHELSYSSATMVISGAYTSESGIVTLYCQAYDSSPESIKLFISGI